MKRLFDLVLSALALLLLSPLLVLLAVLVRLRLGAPVLFRQKRVGQGGEPFVLVKFRSMTDARDVRGNLLPDAARLTSFGCWLRRTSLDELPELWNILRGEMSFVGPRPLLPEYLPLYSPRQARRHAVKPGLTGWAQIHGRNALSWAERLELDVWYVENRTFWLDLVILWRTLAMVASGAGVSQAGHVTMPRFQGSADDAGKRDG